MDIRKANLSWDRRDKNSFKVVEQVGDRVDLSSKLGYETKPLFEGTDEEIMTRIMGMLRVLVHKHGMNSKVIHAEMFRNITQYKEFDHFSFMVALGKTPKRIKQYKSSRKLKFPRLKNVCLVTITIAIVVLAWVQWKDLALKEQARDRARRARVIR